MDLDDFRSFEQLAQVLHFARAARILGVSASALTRRVQMMEQTLGHTLFERDHRAIRLTEAGLRFRIFSRHQLEQWEQLLDELRGQASAPIGELKIACTVTACHTLLPDLLSEFRTLYPGITLHLLTQDAAVSLQQLEASEVDLAVIPTEDQLHPSLESVGIAHTELSFIAPLGSAWIELSRTKKKLNELPFVAPIAGLEQSRLLQWLKSNQLNPPIMAEVRGNEGIISMVALGAGIALIPRLVLENSPLRSRVVELTHLKPPDGYRISLCAKKTALSRRVVELFFEHTARTAQKRTPKRSN